MKCIKHSNCAGEIENNVLEKSQVRARLLNMNYSYGYALRSQALLDEGRTEDAMELALRAVNLSPENDIAHMALCWARFEAGDKPGASRRSGRL